VPGITELPRRYDVTITVDRDGGSSPNPAEFAVAAGQAASARVASIVSAHTASQIISIVTVLVADQPVAVAVALAPFDAYTHAHTSGARQGRLRSRGGWARLSRQATVGYQGDQAVRREQFISLVHLSPAVRSDCFRRIGCGRGIPHVIDQ
jgi:hypothetical protein